MGNLWPESLNNVSRNIANVAENDGRRAATKDIQSVCRSLECIEENNITVWDNDNETVVDSTNNDASSNGLLTDSDCANDVDASSKSLTNDIIPNGQCSVNNSAGVKLPERHQVVKYKTTDDNESTWQAVKILGPAGKKTGKNKNWLNVKDTNTGSSYSMNWSNVKMIGNW